VLSRWWNLGIRRLDTDVALVLDLGRPVLPTITPDDPAAVERILTERATLSRPRAAFRKLRKLRTD
jgi:hypothetical protein